MRRLMSGCAALSMVFGVLGAVGAQTASAATGTAAAANTSARADFNRDGFADLAVGAPGENTDRGVVNVIYGSASGLISRRNQYWTQDSAGIIGTAELGDGFGAALASGDFNGDGFADLAVGAPGENADRGVVNVIYGSASGLTSRRNQYWTQDSAGILGTAQVRDSFGWSLAVANFGKSGHADLAVGAPSSGFTEDDVPNDGSKGSVNVIYGSTSGLTATGDQYWSQDSAGIIGTAAFSDSFGFSLAAANFGKSGYADLAVGVPNDNSTRLDADWIGSGAVNVIYGSASGLSAAGDQYWTQNSTGIIGTARWSDEFGISLAAANFGKSGYADLAVGAPGDNVGRGEVNVIYGSTNGLTASGDQYWTQDIAGIIGTAEGFDFFGSALSSGDFDGDGFADLAVGVPGENASRVGPVDFGRGAVNVIHGSTRGLTAAGGQYWTQDSAGIIGSAERNDQFGDGLAVGDFDGDGFADLAVGAFGENSFRGAVNLIYGTTRGLTAAGDQYWTQDSPGIIGSAEIGDVFGLAVASRR